MIDDQLRRAAEGVLKACQSRNLKVATAESCTGGLIGAALTEIAGSSAVVDRGFITYSNAAKRELLDVPADMLAQHGAVSEPVARAMAAGALARSAADIVVAVTGVAGPGGGTAEKPVGRVHLACARRNGPVVHIQRDYGDPGRATVRHATAIDALRLIVDAALGNST